MGEWGGFIDEEHDPDGSNTKWLTCLRDLMIENRIHHTFWCFNENSGDTGGLVYDNFGKWDEEKYALVKPALWQNQSGKFISLDHKIALGEAGNGISLGEYYSGGSTEPSTKPTETTSSTVSEVLKGDANCDGSVDIADAVATASYVGNSEKNKLTEQGLINGDVQGNGNGINANDALAIQQYLANIIKEFDS